MPEEKTRQQLLEEIAALPTGRIIATTVLILRQRLATTGIVDDEFIKWDNPELLAAQAGGLIAKSNTEVSPPGIIVWLHNSRRRRSHSDQRKAYAANTAFSTIRGCCSGISMGEAGTTSLRSEVAVAHRSDALAPVDALQNWPKSSLGIDL